MLYNIGEILKYHTKHNDENIILLPIIIGYDYRRRTVDFRFHYNELRHTKFRLKIKKDTNCAWFTDPVFI